jgi:hypothetical protein
LSLVCFLDAAPSLETFILSVSHCLPYKYNHWLWSKHSSILLLILRYQYRQSVWTVNRFLETSHLFGECQDTAMASSRE